jgi:NAD(P)H-dependent FMN reductase
MKFIGLLGSPNAAGRTRLVGQAIASGIGKANGQVDMISVAGGPSDEIIQACDHADGLLLGCPVYRGGMAYPLKTLLDHMPTGMWGETLAPLLGKPAGIYMTGRPASRLSPEAPRAVENLRGLVTGHYREDRRSGSPPRR